MSTLPPSPDDWSAQQPKLGTTPGFGARARERRLQPDRRQRLWWSMLYGSVRPRRRLPARRLDDGRFQAMDWHGAHLWTVSILILILSVADAFLTVTLMAGGAVEVNPFMAIFVGSNVAVFAGLKMTMTGVSVLMMVFLARYRFMRAVRVEVILYGVLAAYVVLIAYEMRMLHTFPGPQLL